MTLATQPIRKSLRTRQHLAETGFRLFERHGFVAVTMEQIARSAQVARGTLYNHFPVKEALLVHAMHDQLAADLHDLFAGLADKPDFMARAASLLEASADWWVPRRKYVAPYVRYRFQQLDMPEGKQSGDDSAMRDAWLQLIEPAQYSGTLRADVPAERLAQYLHYLYLSELMRWRADPARPLADGLADMLEFFCRGAASR